VVIPAFNEALRLPPTLARIAAHLEADGSWLPAEIVVVDDGSRDGTAAAAVLDRAPAGIDLRVLVHEKNRGKGAAVRTGFAAAAGTWVLLTDADLSAPIEDLAVLAPAAAPHGVAVGSRAVDRRLVSTRQPRHRDFMGRSFNLVLRALRLTRLGDTQCGFKLFPGDLARALAAVQRLDGFAFDVELLLLAAHWGTPVIEVGVHWKHVEASRVLALRHSREMLRDALRLAWWRARGLLPPSPGGAVP
jgi:dolichyl-phosphate beta-glucosyltransferase